MTAKQFIIEYTKKNNVTKGMETNMALIELLNEFAAAKMAELREEIKKEIKNSIGGHPKLESSIDKIVNEQIETEIRFVSF